MRHAAARNAREPHEPKRRDRAEGERGEMSIRARKYWAGVVIQTAITLVAVPLYLFGPLWLFVAVYLAGTFLNGYFVDRHFRAAWMIPYNP
jgi:hypothetical protein